MKDIILALKYREMDTRKFRNMNCIAISLAVLIKVSVICLSIVSGREEW